MSSETGSLTYRTVQPTAGQPPHPAIFLLHGRGSNELDLLSLGHELDPRLLVVSPRAPHTLGPEAYYWYDLEAALVGRPSPDDLEYSLNLVTRLIGEIQETFDVDVKRIFIGGFSMGGAMTAGMLLLHPEIMAGALILSGYVPVHSGLQWRIDEIAEKKVFQAHGVYDNVLPIEFGRMSRDFLQQAKVDLTYREYPIAHHVSQPQLADASSWMRGILDPPQ